MISDLMQDKGLDHQLNFDELPSLSSLVDETFEDAEASNVDALTLKDGRLNAPFLLRNARILLMAQDFELAKSIFHKLIESGEALGAAYAGMGVCLEREGNYDASIKAYREAIIYEPSFTSLIALADLYIKQQDFRSAIKTLLRANHLPKIRKSESFRIHRSLGHCYLGINSLDHAQKHYKIAFELNSEDENLNIGLGCYALIKNELNMADAHFQEAIRIGGESAKALTGAGYIKYLNKDDAQAIEYFSRALKKNASESNALFYLLKSAFRSGEFTNAIILTELFIRNNPINSSILYALAAMYHHQQRLDDAIATCDQLLQMNPDHQAAANLRKICSNATPKIL